MKLFLNSIGVSIFVMLVLQSGFGQTRYPGVYAEKFSVQDERLPKRFFFAPEDVMLLDSRFKGNAVRSGEWLMRLSADRLLHGFRTNAGVYGGNEGGYMTVHQLKGWESLDCELRGHSVGHILSALAFQYAASGKTVFKLKADSIVSGLDVVQQSLNRNGYLSAFPEFLIDRNISAQKVWAPWYTLHKIMAGLMDQYLYAENQQALNIAIKMGEWAYGKLKDVKDSVRSLMLRNEFGGVNETFYNLYALSGRNEFKWLGNFFYHNEMLDPLVEKVDILEKKHANTFIPKLLGVIRHHELDENYAGLPLADFFWSTVVNRHSFVTGSNSDKEKFFKAGHQFEHLSGYTGESCNVYNMLKLTNHLYALTAEARYPAYYEKAMVNHILGQQDTASGMIAYFLPFMPGAHKVYSTPDSSFWCCVGSGFENQAKYGEAIYAHDNEKLYLNLFVPSQLSWKAKGLVLEMKTAFPYNGKITCAIKDAPAEAIDINVRYPEWAGMNALVKINGKKIKVRAVKDGYIALKRIWKRDDKIEIEFPFSLRLVQCGEDSTKAAVVFGPVVLAGTFGREGFRDRQPFSDPLLYNDYYTYNYNVPENFQASLSINGNAIQNELELVPGTTMTFRSRKEGYLLKPLFDIHRERYVVYWNINKTEK